MLLWVLEKEGRNSDLLLPYALFVIQNTTQASSGQSPLKFAFGQRPGGLLAMKDLMESTLVQKGADLTPSQNEYLTVLVYRFEDVFRSNPAN
ncbi:hypothetical protein KOW79_016135 [Hemibagrus wyckioides]|uniref:Uncharacterized protein n=1 Tax=Hemibagrus wyckioides TaxID=337641 RepID=A0A9D3NGB1_9TELE|nr:hypothetical protein KOW79_016135 [Hemibagrus wyckioides]